MAEGAAASGDVAFFAALPDSQLQPQLQRKDEDGRTLLHTAAGAGAQRASPLQLPRAVA